MLMYVVLKVVFFGVVVVIMFGFGCVFGEIMIVLMVIGNILILSWGFIEGLCVLMVNLVIELFEVDVFFVYY